MKKIIIIISITAITLLNTCNDNPIAPEDKPGRRDYTWIVDTLFNYAYMNKLWGSSPDDIWAIGQPGDFSKTIWHFNGSEWNTDDVFRFISPHSIYGFSSDNVFIGCQNGMIWNFDGNVWEEKAVLIKDGNTQIVFDNMWGSSPNDFYALGAYPDNNHLYNKSTIAHYSNNNWTMLNTSGLTGLVERLYKNKTDKKIYVQTYRICGGESFDSTLIYEYSSTGYTKIYSSVWTKGLQADISLINDEVYFVLEKKIAKRTDNKFDTIINIDNSDFYQRIWGRNSKDIFLLMTDGLAHYNGDDIEYLLIFNKPRTQIYIGGAILFDNEVFFMADESQTGMYLIYHGILNE